MPPISIKTFPSPTGSKSNSRPTTTTATTSTAQNPTPTLVLMAARAAARNVTDIVDVGQMPYDVAIHVLKTIKSPVQLHEIEENCPHIADSDAELWKAFIIRDIPNWEDKMIYPKNPRSWWKVYRKLIREEELIEAAQEEALRKQLVKNTIMKSEQSATYVPEVVSFAATTADARIDPVARLRAAAASGRWTKKSKSGGKIVSTIRREAAEARSIRKPFQPTHAGGSLAAAKRQISHAPAAMVPGARRVQPRALLPHQEALLHDHQRLRTEIHIPRRVVAPSTAITNALAQKREINEKKLRELTNSRPASKQKAAPAPATTVKQHRTKIEKEKVIQAEMITNVATPKRKNVEVQEMISIHSPTAEYASPQSSSASQQPALTKKKRPAAANIFMAKKQKR